MGLRAPPGPTLPHGKIQKFDVVAAKNYMTDAERAALAARAYARAESEFEKYRGISVYRSSLSLVPFVLVLALRLELPVGDEDHRGLGLDDDRGCDDY
jgi:hypothetical protein